MKPACPVPGSATVVRDRENLEPIRKLHVNDVIGEAVNRSPADALIRDPRYQRSQQRGLRNSCNREIDRVQELRAQARAIHLVSASGFYHLGVRLLADPNGKRQRLPNAYPTCPWPRPEPLPRVSPRLHRTERARPGARSQPPMRLPRPGPAPHRGSRATRLPVPPALRLRAGVPRRVPSGSSCSSRPSSRRRRRATRR